ncbi:MAG: folate-binding protein YgfZ [Proteobacteria bacterium]|nr:folate-binding protein YgfZ [Pseudomonadota bacterium]
MVEAALLEHRGALKVAGADARPFLQGLISNDITKVTPARAIHAGLLTAQGRYLHDFIVVELGEALLLETERARLTDLRKRLSLYKLRAKVTIEPADDLAVVAFWPEAALVPLGLPAEPGAAKPHAGGVALVDPRLAALGARALVPAARLDEALAGFVRGALGGYDRHRLALGVPDGSRDLIVEKSLLLENGFDELNGVDWHKGCYVGQELTARTKYRGLVKKRLLPVAIDGAPPAPGTPIALGARDAGEMRSAADGLGLALLRLEMVDAAALEGEALTAGDARLTVQRPQWLKM